MKNDVREEKRERIEVEVKEGVKLIVEKNAAPFDKELFVYLESGCVCQDLVMVSPEYEYPNNGDVFIKYLEDRVSVRVWSDSQDEDFTKEYLIPIVEEDVK